MLKQLESRMQVGESGVIERLWMASEIGTLLRYYQEEYSKLPLLAHPINSFNLVDFQIQLSTG